MTDLKEVFEYIKECHIPWEDPTKNSFGERYTTHRAAMLQGKLTAEIGYGKRENDALLTTVQPDRDDPESLEAVYVMGDLKVTFSEPTGNPLEGLKSQIINYVK